MCLPAEELGLGPDALRRLGIDANLPFAILNRQVRKRTHRHATRFSAGRATSAAVGDEQGIAVLLEAQGQVSGCQAADEGFLYPTELDGQIVVGIVGVELAFYRTSG